jgi:hypothetical protein
MNGEKGKECSWDLEKEDNEGTVNAKSDSAQSKINYC